MRGIAAAWYLRCCVSPFATCPKDQDEPLCRAPKMAVVKVVVAHVPFKSMRWITNQVHMSLADPHTMGIALY